jgi:hypothetical protein
MVIAAMPHPPACTERPGGVEGKSWCDLGDQTVQSGGPVKNIFAVFKAAFLET